MTSSRPYLVRAMFEWLVDNELTPYLMVDTTIDGCEVPTDFIEDDRIVLNVAPQAVRHLDISNDRVSFDARFSGVVYSIYVPMHAVQAIYASENGRGMVFDQDDDDMDDDGEAGSSDQEPKVGKPNLRVIK